jgi:uncharacterized protein (DUF302 family)
MCWNRYLYAVAGILLGMAVLLTGGYFGAQSLMVVETESPYDFETTLRAINTAAQELDWKVPKVYRLCNSLEKEGYSIRPVVVVELCKPDYAAELLIDDSTRFVSSFMPCRISVYERSDGSVVVSRMNTKLVSRLFRGKTAEVMAVATEETQAMLDRALEVASNGAADSVTRFDTVQG